MILLAHSEGPDQTAHLRSLIWAFAVRIYSKTHFFHGATHNIFKVVILYLMIIDCMHLYFCKFFNEVIIVFFDEIFYHR